MAKYGLKHVILLVWYKYSHLLTFSLHANMAWADKLLFSSCLTLSTLAKSWKGSVWYESLFRQNISKNKIGIYSNTLEPQLWNCWQYEKQLWHRNIMNKIYWQK